MTNTNTTPRGFRAYAASRQEFYRTDLIANREDTGVIGKKSPETRARERREHAQYVRDKKAQCPTHFVSTADCGCGQEA